MGIAYLRNMGSEYDLRAALDLGRQLRRLGKHVPVFKVSHEGRGRFNLWQPQKDVDLADSPYSLEEVYY